MEYHVGGKCNARGDAEAQGQRQRDDTHGGTAPRSLSKSPRKSSGGWVKESGQPVAASAQSNEQNMLAGCWTSL